MFFRTSLVTINNLRKTNKLIITYTEKGWVWADTLIKMAHLKLNKQSPFFHKAAWLLKTSARQKQEKQFISKMDKHKFEYLFVLLVSLFSFHFSLRLSNLVP